MIKKAISITIAIGLGLILGIFISGGIRITKANTPVATLQATDLDRVETGEPNLGQRNAKDTLELHTLLKLDRQLLPNLTNNSLGRNSLDQLEQLNPLENTRGSLLGATLALNLS